MSDQQVQALIVGMAELKAMLSERCATHKKDIDHAHKNIRILKEEQTAMKSDIHEQDKVLAKWSLLSSIATAALTAGALRFFGV